MGGIDYFGSDIGGFHRGGILDRKSLLEQGITTNTSFTMWLANSVLTDIPVRTHCSQNPCVNNVCAYDSSMQTNPATVGDVNVIVFYIHWVIDNLVKSIQHSNPIRAVPLLLFTCTQSILAL